jgi:hypothetical protein
LTAQIPDFLAYGGRQLALHTNPLESYFEQHPPRPNFVPENTANWRGYVARWEVKNDKLHLVSLSGTVCVKRAEKGGWTSAWCRVGHRGECERRTIGLSDLFDSTTDMVFAEWFSGELRIPEGDLVEYDHMGYASRYERNLLISVENGVLVGTRILSDEAYQKELESQAPSPEVPRSLWARLWRVVASQRS